MNIVIILDGEKNFFRDTPTPMSWFITVQSIHSHRHIKRGQYITISVVITSLVVDYIHGLCVIYYYLYNSIVNIRSSLYYDISYFLGWKRSDMIS